MYIWFDLLQIACACLFCGFLGSHSTPAAVVVVALQLFIAWLGQWFNTMDLLGLAMLVLPAVCATAGALIGAAVRRRQREEDANPAFVPPPPPEGWVPRSRRRPKPSDDSFTL